MCLSNITAAFCNLHLFPFLSDYDELMGLNPLYNEIWAIKFIGVTFLIVFLTSLFLNNSKNRGILFRLMQCVSGIFLTLYVVLFITIVAFYALEALHAYQDKYIAPVLFAVVFPTLLLLYILKKRNILSLLVQWASGFMMIVCFVISVAFSVSEHSFIKCQMKLDAISVNIEGIKLRMLGPSEAKPDHAPYALPGIYNSSLSDRGVYLSAYTTIGNEAFFVTEGEEYIVVDRTTGHVNRLFKDGYDYELNRQLYYYALQKYKIDIFDSAKRWHDMCEPIQKMRILNNIRFLGICPTKCYAVNLVSFYRNSFKCQNPFDIKVKFEGIVIHLSPAPARNENSYHATYVNPQIYNSMLSNNAVTILAYTVIGNEVVFVTAASNFIVVNRKSGQINKYYSDRSEDKRLLSYHPIVVTIASEQIHKNFKGRLKNKRLLSNYAMEKYKTDIFKSEDRWKGMCDSLNVIGIIRKIDNFEPCNVKCISDTRAFFDDYF